MFCFESLPRRQRPAVCRPTESQVMSTGTPRKLTIRRGFGGICESQSARAIGGQREIEDGYEHTQEVDCDGAVRV